MKKVATLVLAAALALATAACAPARAGSDVADAGFATGSEQAVAPEPAAEVETEPEEPEIPEYDPIELERDNPLADVEISSIKLRVTAVGEQELSDADTQTILGIIQNDARAYVERYSYWPSKDSGDINNSTCPWFVVTLESGEEIEALGLQNVARTNLYLNGCCFELTDEEYAAFSALSDEYRPQVIDAADEVLAPYADLTAARLDKIVRLDYDEMTYEDLNLELSDEQVEMLVATLRELEIEPATAEFGHESLYGGEGRVFSYFELWFKDGTHYEVGEFSRHSIYDENNQFVESYPVAYIDGVIFRCNEEYDHDMYWDYQETDPDYEPSGSYTSARSFPDYRFEGMDADEIEYIGAGVSDGLILSSREVPLSLADEAVEVLGKLRLSDDARNDERVDELTEEEYEGVFQLAIHLSNTDSIWLGVNDDCVFFNYRFYEEDAEALEALQDFIDLARDEAGL